MPFKVIKGDKKSKYYYLIDDVVYIGSDCAGAIRFHDLDYYDKMYSYSGDDLENKSELLKAAETLKCYVKYVKYELLNTGGYIWKMPKFIVLQRDDDRLIITEEYGRIICNQIKVEEKCYENCSNLIKHEPILYRDSEYKIYNNKIVPK